MLDGAGLVETNGMTVHDSRMCGCEGRFLQARHQAALLRIANDLHTHAHTHRHRHTHRGYFRVLVSDIRVRLFVLIYTKVILSIVHAFTKLYFKHDVPCLP